MKVFGRLLIQVLAFTLLIPIKIVMIIYVVGEGIYFAIVDHDSIFKYYKEVIEGAKEQFNKEIYWVKTGIILQDREES